MTILSTDKIAIDYFTGTPQPRMLPADAEFLGVVGVGNRIDVHYRSATRLEDKANVAHRKFVFLALSNGATVEAGSFEFIGLAMPAERPAVAVFVVEPVPRS